MTAEFIEPSARTPAMPQITVEDGVPHIWCPDLDANEYTPAKLAMAFTTLAVTHPDAILDDTETDISGSYFAWRMPTQDVPVGA